MARFRRNYDTIKRKIKKNNSVCVYDITTSGEALSGTFTIGVVLSLLREHIKNDTFHPYLFRYLCCSSIGSIVVDFLFKIWFLYETQEDKQIALDFIDVCGSVITFENCRNIFASVDTDELLEFSNSYKLITNFLCKGGIMSRDGLLKLLRLEHDIFQPFKTYFDTDEFFAWRKPHLPNVFITVQSTETTVSSIFTGKPHLFKTESKLIKFCKLTNANFEHIVCCTTSLPILFEPLQLDGIESVTDGSLFIRNPMHIPQILHNFSYYNNVEELFAPVLDYFEIQKDDFIIHNDVLNSQTYFEMVPSIQTIPNKPLQAIYTLAQRFTRGLELARNNFELSSIAYTQPILVDFSTCDANEVKGVAYDYNVHVANRPDNLAKLRSLKIDSKPDLEKFSQLSSVLPVSSYIYDARTFTHGRRTVHLIDTNTFIRTLFDTISTRLTVVDLPLNNNTEENKNRILDCYNSGLLQGHVLHDIHKRRSRLDWKQMSAIIQTAYDNFLGC